MRRAPMNRHQPLDQAKARRSLAEQLGEVTPTTMGAEGYVVLDRASNTGWNPGMRRTGLSEDQHPRPHRDWDD